MAEVEDTEKSSHRHHHISSTTTTPMSNFSRDLLNRFMAANNHHHRQQQQQHLPDHADAAEEGEEEELELSLGLSMNGRFGVDPTAKKIKRTSSIPEFVNPGRDEEMGGYVVPAVACAPLIRTCSLPTETEEEWKKRKELQTLRRMEARRKRNEKQRNLKALRERFINNRGLSEEVLVEGNNNNLVELQGVGALNEVNNTLRRTTSLTTRVGGLGLNGDEKKEKGSGLLAPPSPPQGSIGSSSGTSESECQQGQGTTPMDTRSPIGANTLPDEQKSPENSGKIATAVTMRNELNKHSAPQNRTKDIARNLLEDMPSVSTKGEGPNGKRIEGFLYRYGKGEEVRILCVCHGSFLTPAEFVKHAGGPDVANPLKHIVVSPSFL